MRFDTNAFAWLNDEGSYMPGWNNITHEELQEHINSLLAQDITDEDAPEVFKSIEAFDAFLNAIGIIEPTEPVLSVLIDSGELLEAVNSPTIYAETTEGADGKPERTGNMVIKVGDYSQPVTVNGTEASINGLTGDCTVEERGDDTNKYLAVTFEVYMEVIDDSIEIDFRLDNKERPEINGFGKGKLKKLIKDGKLPELLKTVPSGESFFKPRDLEVGEYGVISIEENEPHPEYGRSWKIVLEGIGPMMTTGKRLNALLARQDKIYQKQLAQGHPVTFAISNKAELSQGVRVDCGFFKRAPKAERMVKAAKPVATISQSPEVAALPQTVQTLNVTAEPVQRELVEHAF